MTDVSDLIEQTRRHLYGTYRALYNRNSDPLTDATTSITFDFELGRIAAGSIISIDDELIYVWEVNTTTHVATVVSRGWMGTTAAAHDDGSLVEVSPRFPTVLVRQALLDELRSWPDSLYRVDTEEITAVVSTRGYDFPVVPFHDIIEVRRSPLTCEYGIWPEIKEFSVDRHASVTEYTSGQALYINEGLPTTTETLKVLYSAPFSLDYFDDGIDLTYDIGLPESTYDIPPLGAAWRLLAPREVRRSFVEAQGESRRSEEVAPNAAMQTAANLKRLRDERLREEAAKIQAKRSWKW
jgi:hypothetical protein